MKLTSIQAQIISALQLRADEPISKLRKKLGLRDHTVRYAIDRAIAQDLIERRYFLNLFRLGYQQHEVFFSLSSEKRHEREQLIKDLVATTCISWIGKLGGDYQYGINICVRHPSELLDLFEKLSARYGKIFLEKSFVQLLSLHYFGNRYISAKPQKSVPLSYKISREAVTIDETDHKILAGLTRGPIESIHHLARSLGIPQSTVDYRIKSLRTSGVIVGSYYSLRTHKIAMLSFLCLICSKGISSSLEDKVLGFCMKNTAVITSIRTLGSWDYQLVINVARTEDVVTIGEDLVEELGTDLHWYKMLPLFAYAKVREYPFG
jgi:DNA-binding Lrp family transcriptional regulator